MLHPILRTLVKVVVASLVVGTILAHFGITAEQLMHESGLSAERIEDYAQTGLRLGLAALAARLAGDRADLVSDLSVPPAAPAQQQQRLARQAAGGAGSGFGPRSGTGIRGAGP